MHDCRDFLMSNYAEMKKANPYFPILVRESAGVEAKLIARYGEHVCISAQNANKLQWWMCSLQSL